MLSSAPAGLLLHIFQKWSSPHSQLSRFSMERSTSAWGWSMGACDRFLRNNHRRLPAQAICILMSSSVTDITIVQRSIKKKVVMKHEKERAYNEIQFIQHYLQLIVRRITCDRIALRCAWVTLSASSWWNGYPVRRWRWVRRRWRWARVIRRSWLRVHWLLGNELLRLLVLLLPSI